MTIYYTLSFCVLIKTGEFWTSPYSFNKRPPTITREKEIDNNADLKTIIRGPVKELELLKNKNEFGGFPPPQARIDNTVMIMNCSNKGLNLNE